MTQDTLQIEEASRDRTYKTMCITGLSVEEMNEVLDNHDALGEVMEKYGMGSTYRCWHNGYGIYSIRHIGGHLLVEIGNSCD